MKNYITLLQQIALFLISGLASMQIVHAQTYKPGDVYTFEDGSRGVVFYVNPDDPSRGTVVALNDLDGEYALWTGSKPVGLQTVFYAPEMNPQSISGWQPHGKPFTQVLAASGHSPAANAMDVGQGWYIPDILQLNQLFVQALDLQPVFESNGGEIVSLWDKSHWSSTQEGRSSNRVYCLTTVNKADRQYGTTIRYIRPVRDFPDTSQIRAYWADNPPKTDTLVHPDTTTTYDALVIYRSDTMSMVSTVIVLLPTADTLFDTTYVSALPYVSSIAPFFRNIDISFSGSYEYIDTIQNMLGCDSIVTLMLTVHNHVRYTDTLCSLKEDYYFAPFDTVFSVGTVSGVYEHHGSKTVDGVTVDTLAYFDLTILPVYEVFDTIGWCLYEMSETRPYEGNTHVSVTVSGSSVSVVSDTEEVVVEEITAGSDYRLKMQAVSGCDSVVLLHVDARRVPRDTVRYAAYIHQIEDGKVTISGHTFTGIAAAGSYEQQDTLTAANGCDSVVVHALTVIPCVSDFSIDCPPDYYDTLAFGDCAMKVYPESLGTPIVHCDIEWPFRIGNDYPLDSLFSQGDNIITWTATDTVCGKSVSCGQHVWVAFPACPDAVDFEGNVYPGVRIGCDCWTQRNLESKKYSDGGGIAGKYAYASIMFPDTTANVAVYGRLYSHVAAVRDSTDNGHGHIQGICPDGWYLPIPEQYAKLNEYGAESLRTPHLWAVGGGDNSTGFSALPAGFYNGEQNRYEGLLTEAYFWSTEGVESATKKYSFSILYYCDKVQQHSLMSGLGYSVRCIKEK